MDNVANEIINKIEEYERLYKDCLCNGCDMMVWFALEVIEEQKEALHEIMANFIMGKIDLDYNIAIKADKLLKG